MAELLFLDIETFRDKEWELLTSVKRQAFENHYLDKDSELSPKEQYNSKAGLLAEFGRVVCISYGAEVNGVFELDSIYGTDERELLIKFGEILNQLGDKEVGIAGWNTNGFDIPFLAKRFIINDLKVPIMLNQGDVKPWERLDVDVMQVWKMTGYQSTSLEVACACFEYPTKFTEVTGSNIWEVEKLENLDLEQLASYCKNDVASSYLIYKKLESCNVF